MVKLNALNQHLVLLHQTQLTNNLAYGHDQLACQSLIIQRVDILHVPLRDNQRVNGCLWMNIEECRRHVILPEQYTRIAIGEIAKKTVFHSSIIYVISIFVAFSSHLWLTDMPFMDEDTRFA